MKLRAMLVGMLLPVVLGRPCDAMTRIADDMGGSLGEYLLMFAAIRDSGERVMIDGSCFSACTLVTALIPRDRICITERAMLGFGHSWIAAKIAHMLAASASVHPPRLSWETTTRPRFRNQIGTLDQLPLRDGETVLPASIGAMASLAQAGGAIVSQWR